MLHSRLVQGLVLGLGLIASPLGPAAAQSAEKSPLTEQSKPSGEDLAMEMRPRGDALICAAGATCMDVPFIDADGLDLSLGNRGIKDLGLPLVDGGRNNMTVPRVDIGGQNCSIVPKYCLLIDDPTSNPACKCLD